MFALHHLPIVILLRKSTSKEFGNEETSNQEAARYTRTSLGAEVKLLRLLK